MQDIAVVPKSRSSSKALLLVFGASALLVGAYHAGGALTGRALATTVSPNVQGFFMDAAHHAPGSWKGIRIISDAVGTTAGNKLTLMGTDDGDTWWMLEGTNDGGSLSIDFSPKGGPASISATWSYESGGSILFGDGNTWERIDSITVPGGPTFGPRLAEAGTAGYIQGVFLDSNHYDAKAKSFAGMRFITDAVGATVGSTVTLIGNDEGDVWWMLKGTIDKKTGAVSVDFSPKGGPSDIAATYTASDGKLTFGDGNVWQHAMQAS